MLGHPPHQQTEHGLLLLVRYDSTDWGPQHTSSSLMEMSRYKFTLQGQLELGTTARGSQGATRVDTGQETTPCVGFWATSASFQRTAPTPRCLDRRFPLDLSAVQRGGSNSQCPDIGLVLHLPGNGRKGDRVRGRYRGHCRETLGSRVSNSTTAPNSDVASKRHRSKGVKSSGRGNKSLQGTDLPPTRPCQLHLRYFLNSVFWS